MPENTGTTYKYGFNPGEGANIGKRRKISLKTIESEIPSEIEVDRKIKEMEQKLGKKPKKRPLPKGVAEDYPGKEFYLA